jgi:hypothetical protein
MHDRRKRRRPMKWKMMLGMVVAVGSLAATEVRAQGNEAGSGATPAVQQEEAKSDQGDYGKIVNEPATVDADGVPVAKPNPMSGYLERARTFGNSPVEMPLVDDARADGPATGGQTN